MGIADLKAADRAHQERRERAAKGQNVKANRAVAARWVGGAGGAQMTAEELAVWAAGLRADFYSRHPELGL